MKGKPDAPAWEGDKKAGGTSGSAGRRVSRKNQGDIGSRHVTGGTFVGDSAVLLPGHKVKGSR